MEDRFKFRTWDKVFKQIDYTCVATNILTSFHEDDMEYLEEDKERFILMQCTGIKDKNGKLIFEGDILKIKDIMSDECIFNEDFRALTKVVFYEKKAAFIPQDIKQNHKGGHYIHYWDHLDDVEIIGNIYENPKLLKI